MKRPAPANPGVNLFPFLAILICTMGTLILLLSIINRHTSREDVREAAAERTAREDDAKIRREELLWRIEHLRSSQEKTHHDLADDRLRLSGIEDHIRELISNLQNLQQQALAMDQDGSKTSTNVELTQSQIDQLRQQARQAADRAAEARQHAGNGKPSYAIIPYFGPHGTARRPIYIECRGDAVIVQPEGVKFAPEDFAGPPGPGNPLAAALRAARERMMQDEDRPAEPYPLLLVRPDGIAAYYACRGALESWASDFGYDLIEQDWDLQFPPPDERLAQTIRQAVEDARQRLQWYVAANPARTSARAKPRYRVAAGGGGLVREGNVALKQSVLDSPWLGGQSGAVARANPTAGNSAASGGAEPESKSLGDSAEGPLSGTPGKSRLEFDAPQDGSLTQGAPANLSAANSENGPSSPNQASPGSGTATALSPRSGQSRAGGARPPQSQAASRQRDQQSVPPDGQPVALRPGEYVDPPPRETIERKRDDKESTKERRKVRSLAETRGRNWSLPSHVRNSASITRPIRVECRGDRLIILPDTENGLPREVPLPSRSEGAVDELVAAIWQHTEAWGLAGRAMYWKPQIVLEIGPSGEGRAAEFEELLANSGLETRRR